MGKVKAVTQSKKAINESKQSKPSAGKSWTDKLQAPKEPLVKRIEKDFADMPSGSNMLIATPKIIDEYIKQIPKGGSVSLQTMRKDLAVGFHADNTCPVTTGIFLRIVSEAAHEQIENGKRTGSVTPFWRVVDEKSSLAKKLSFDVEFIKEQRSKEGIDVPEKRERKK